MAAVQEMLLQSHTGTIVVFPAIPADWKDVAFTRFLAQGGIEVSATMTDGRIERLTLTNTRPTEVTTQVAVGYEGTPVSVTLAGGETADVETSAMD